MKVTIKEVAQEAGVSVATVSRVLNNNGKVSPEAVDAVNRAIEKLGYSPNLLGRNLRRSETKRILAIISSTERSFYSEALRGMQDAAQAEGYDILIATSRNDPDHEMRLLGMLFARAVDGAVLLAPKLDAATISSLAERYNLAMCLERLEGCDILCVTIDNELAAYDAVKCLLSKGRKRIGLLTTKERSQSSIDRENGYKRALTEAGIPTDERLIYHGGYEAEMGAAGCEALLKLTPPPDAIFCISDVIAIGAMNRALELGVAVGREVLFIGFDNITFSRMVKPALSTVGQPCYLQGKTVVEKLIANIRGEEADKGLYKLEHSLVLRETTMD